MRRFGKKGSLYLPETELIYSPPEGLEEEWNMLVHDRYYTEIGHIGSMNTAKTNALINFFNVVAMDYPGAKIMVGRGEGTALRKTTFEALLDLFAAQGVEWEDKQQLIIRWPEVNGKVSRAFGYGLNTNGDLRDKLKSTEFAAAGLDEGNELKPSLAANLTEADKMSIILLRCRQKVYHRETYFERAERMIYQGVLSGFDEAVDYFELHDEEALHSREKFRNTFRSVANDENDWYWTYMVNRYGDKPHPPDNLNWYKTMYPDVESTYKGFKRWVRENVGATEIHVPKEFDPKFRQGHLVYLPKEKRYDQVELVNADNTILKLKGGATIPTQACSLVIERYCIYSFTDDNKSRNREADDLVYLGTEKMVKQYTQGLIDTERGKLFPEFGSLHQLERIEDFSFADNQNWRCVIQMDYNIVPVCVTFKLVNAFGEQIIFREYEGQTPEHTSTHAFSVAKILLNSLGWDISDSRVIIIADPAMWAKHRDRNNPRQQVKSTIQEFREAWGGKKIFKANNARTEGLNKLKDDLAIKARIKGGRMINRPNLWVTKDCSVLIHGSEHNMGLATMTWETWRREKLDHMITTVRYGQQTPQANSFYTDTSFLDQDKAFSKQVVKRSLSYGG